MSEGIRLRTASEVEDGLPVEQRVELTSEKFSFMVEGMVADEGMGYVEAAAEAFERLGLESEENVHLLSKTLIEKIKAEALKNNQLKEKFTAVSLIN